MKAACCVLLLGFLCLQTFGQGEARPSLCNLPKAGGGPGPMCLGYFPSFFYNAATGTCEKFIYGGCFGNENRFGTIEACQKTCAS
ncbi:hypothetical protein BsWGS_23811 [Bradybaena similaris]